MADDFLALTLFAAAIALIVGAAALCMIAARLREICAFLHSLTVEAIYRRQSEDDDDGEGWKTR